LLAQSRIAATTDVFNESKCHALILGVPSPVTRHLKLVSFSVTHDGGAQIRSLRTPSVLNAQASLARRSISQIVKFKSDFPILRHHSLHAFEVRIFQRLLTFGHCRSARLDAGFGVPQEKKLARYLFLGS
jgi:hypothetical protein